MLRLLAFFKCLVILLVTNFSHSEVKVSIRHGLQGELKLSFSVLKTKSVFNERHHYKNFSHLWVIYLNQNYMKTVSLATKNYYYYYIDQIAQEVSLGYVQL